MYRRTILANVSNCINILNSELQQISNWVDLNQLTLNFPETQIILIGKHENNSRNIPQISLKGESFKGEISSAYIGI